MVPSTKDNVPSKLRSKIQEPREDWKYRRNKLEIIRASSGNKNLYFNPFSRSEPAAAGISILFPTWYLVHCTLYNHFTFPAGFPNTVSFFPTEEITTDPAP
uniref:hypothetical protein n=1 Tax=Algoriphagus sp. TaxID=1872435 RepID=UPI00404756AD